MLLSTAHDTTLLMRVGIGYDSHPFAADRRLILGGVEIPNAKGLAGHSDADAVAHAVTDAILGAAGLGDIGRMFPSDDPRWKNANSIDLLNKAFLKVVEAGFQFVHADVTVIIEKPKLAPHIDAMKERLASALLTRPAHVPAAMGRWSPASCSAATSSRRIPSPISRSSIGGMEPTASFSPGCCPSGVAS